MSLIGTIAASATGVFNLDFLPEKFLINGPANSQNLTNLSVVCSGVQLMSITAVARLNAIAAYDSGAILNDPTAATTSKAAKYLKLATGRVNKATTITGVNGATASNVYAASTNISNVARRAVEQSINPSANATFTDFEALFFEASNVLRVQITFSNGYTDEYSEPELRALYSNFHVTDENGNLGGLVCIDADSGAGLISQVVIYNGSTGSTVVLKSDYVML